MDLILHAAIIIVLDFRFYNPKRYSTNSLTWTKGNHLKIKWGRSYIHNTFAFRRKWFSRLLMSRLLLQIIFPSSPYIIKVFRLCNPKTSTTSFFFFLKYSFFRIYNPKHVNDFWIIYSGHCYTLLLSMMQSIHDCLQVLNDFTFYNRKPFRNLKSETR